MARGTERTALRSGRFNLVRAIRGLDGVTLEKKKMIMSVEALVFDEDLHDYRSSAGMK